MSHLQAFFFMVVTGAFRKEKRNIIIFLFWFWLQKISSRITFVH